MRVVVTEVVEDVVEEVLGISEVEEEGNEISIVVAVDDDVDDALVVDAGKHSKQPRLRPYLVE